MKTFRQYIRERQNVSEYKNHQSWLNMVTTLGYNIKYPTVDRDGNSNRDQHFVVAKDKQGNTKGEWMNKSGWISE